MSDEVRKIEKMMSLVEEKFSTLTLKIESLEDFSSKEAIDLSRDKSSIESTVELIGEYKSMKNEIAELEEIADSNSESDRELVEMANAELPQLRSKNSSILKKVQLELLPKDEADMKNAIVEIRAGAGGDEAALFAGVLLRMYQKLAENYKWNFEILTISDTDLKGMREVTFIVSGVNVFEKLKYEMGVHRVQRIPDTETNGRIHTSTATVAVLPEAKDIDVNLDEKDIRIEVCRASGAGGQHVNKTNSAVRLIHEPTGVAVECQDERSQLKNRERAMKILRSRIYESRIVKARAERSKERMGQIGSGERSERIRTYNYPQGRVTDHRINFTLYKINEITLDGRIDLMIHELLCEELSQKLQDFSV